MGRANSRVSLWIGLGFGSLVAAAYLIGSGRAFDYDSGVTVDAFIRTPSLADPFRRQISFNNHPLFSFLEHLVYTITGSASEWAMRPLPILFAGATVGILVGVVAARRSVWVALAAGAFLALNPLFIAEAREVRGYSLLCLCALGSSLLLERLDRTGRGRLVYILVIAIGTATHLYMLVVVIGHIAWIASRRHLSRLWGFTWTEGVLLGSFVYLGLLRAMLKPSARVFHPGFPYSLSRALLGHNPVLVAVELAGVAAAFWAWRHRRETWFVAAAVSAIITAAWLIGPEYLFPRFFVWMVPGVAAVAALGLARARLLPLAALAIVVVPAAANSFTRDPIANRSAAVVIQPLIRDGLKVCAFPFGYVAFSVYKPSRLTLVDSLAELRGCDATVSIVPEDAITRLAAADRAQFPFVTVLPAEAPGILRSRGPLAVLTSKSWATPSP